MIAAQSQDGCPENDAYCDGVMVTPPPGAEYFPFPCPRATGYGKGRRFEEMRDIAAARLARTKKAEEALRRIATTPLPSSTWSVAAVHEEMTGIAREALEDVDFDA